MSQQTFRNYGGIFQFHLSGPEDLERIDELDKARWAATSIPTVQFNCDPAFLAFLDTDKDGRIRLYDLRAARRWYWERVSVRSAMEVGSDTLQLGHLDGSHAETATARELAELILTEVGSEVRDRITLAQVRTFRTAYAQTMPNGDGVVTAAQVEDAEVKAAIERITGSTGGAPDASGEVGVGTAEVAAYVEAARAFVAWRARAEGEEAAAIFPLGDETAAAAALVDRLAAKMDQFFAQCALVALEEGAAARLQASPEQLAELDVNDPAAIEGWLGKASLARPEADGVLHLDGALNPHYAADLRKLAEDVGPRLLEVEGPLTELKQGDWSAIKGAIGSYLSWMADRPAGIPEDADPAELTAFADGPMPGRLEALSAEDASVAEEVEQFDNLEKLILYQQGLLEFARNFVEMRYLFDPHTPALFQEGTLVIDGRKVNLCMKVVDKAGHKKIAAKSLIFLTYLDLERKDAAGKVHKKQVVAGITAGVRGGIDVGKRGVFYDREDLEWDAIVTDVEVNPISLWEAMIAPFVKLRDTIAARIKKAAEAQQASAEAGMNKAADDQVAAAKSPPPAAGAAPAQQQQGGGFQNALIGGSIAFAALASAGALVVQVFSGITLGELVAIVLGIVAVLMAISAFIAWLRLRKRDLSTYLEATGFALNGRMRLNRYLASTFTLKPGIPKGSKLEQGSPTGTLEKVIAGLVILVLIVAVVLWQRPDWMAALTAALGM